MPKFSSFISKPLLLLFEAKLESKIVGGLLNIKSKRLEYLIIGENSFKQIIAPKKIQFAGDNANVIINDLGIKQFSDIDCSKFVLTPINDKVFTTDGKMLGIITDLELDSEFICTALFLNEERLTTDMVITFGEEIVLVKGEWCPKIVKNISKKVSMPQKDNVKVQILNKSKKAEVEIKYPLLEPISLAQALNKNINISDLTNKTNILKTSENTKNEYETGKKDLTDIEEIIRNYQIEENQKKQKTDIKNEINVDLNEQKGVKTLNTDELLSDDIDTEIDDETQNKDTKSLSSNETTPQEENCNQNKYNNNIHQPARIISDYGFLLGRLVTEDIYNFNNELIANKGEVVTTLLVDKVRNSGKLVELTLNSKN